MSTIHREITIGAPAATVFEFFVDPKLMVRWMGQRAELDARPGGIFRVAINGAMVAEGKFVAVDPPRRVVFTWGWDVDGNPVRPGTSEVEVNLREIDGSTLVIVDHRGLPDDDAVKGHSEGWDHYFERLVTVAAGGDPGPDPWAATPD